MDGDTVEVAISIWPDLTMTIEIRPEGIDTPELTGPPCEKALAKRAARFVEGFLFKAESVIVSGVHYGKFAGRVLGHISRDGKDLADALVKAKHARLWNGRGKKKPWC